jgi:hypothetical protein
MQISQAITDLTAGAEAIAALVRGIDDAQARWKPSAESWSILEVVNHLYDEEREDFRLRLEYTLHYPERPLPPIDPAGWVVSRGYLERRLAPSLADFLAERERSIVWLQAITDPQWEQTANHPQLLDLRAGDLLASWVAHDLLHLRQLIELRYAFHAQRAAPYRVQYAGEW